MDNYEFNLLSTNEKAGYTWENGTFLTARQENIFSINLYHVEKFFVEVWYDPEENCVERIRSFKSKICLEPYLEKIYLNIS